MIVEDIGKNHSGIAVVYKNIGLEYVNGRYIFFLDQSINGYPDNAKDFILFVDEEIRGMDTDWKVMSQEQIENVSSFEKDVRELIDKYEALFRK